LYYLIFLNIERHTTILENHEAFLFSKILYGFTLLAYYFVPLYVVTCIAGSTKIAGCILKSFGEDSIKILGFNACKILARKESIKDIAGATGGVVAMAGLLGYDKSKSLKKKLNDGYDEENLGRAEAKKLRDHQYEMQGLARKHEKEIKVIEYEPEKIGLTQKETYKEDDYCKETPLDVGLTRPRHLRESINKDSSS
jgi:hypothetical protein